VGVVGVDREAEAVGVAGDANVFSPMKWRDDNFLP